MLAAHYRLDGVVTLVDAVNGLGQLDREAEAVKQAALADRLLITKTDLADATALRERLHALNPRADAADVVQGEIDPAFLTGIGLASARADAGQIGRWLGAGSRRGRLPRHGRAAPRSRHHDVHALVRPAVRVADVHRGDGAADVAARAGPAAREGTRERRRRSRSGRRAGRAARLPPAGDARRVAVATTGARGSSSSRAASTSGQCRRCSRRSGWCRAVVHSIDRLARATGSAGRADAPPKSASIVRTSTGF